MSKRECKLVGGLGLNVDVPAFKLLLNALDFDDHLIDRSSGFLKRADLFSEECGIDFGLGHIAACLESRLDRGRNGTHVFDFPISKQEQIERSVFAY